MINQVVKSPVSSVAWGVTERRGLRRPPLWSTKLLNWHPGLKRENIVIDKKSGLGLVMSQSHAVKLDGIGEDGTTSTDHGAIVSHSGTAELVYDGITISTATTDGTVCNLTFEDGTHYRLAEGNGGVSTDDTGVHTIVWAGDIANIRSGTTDDYHANATLGWWEIDGDPVKYQYPVAGFTTYHPANKLTPCETLLAYKENPVGTMDGIVVEINLPFDVPAGATLTYDGTATATLDIANDKIVDSSGVNGTIRNVVVKDSNSAVLASYKVDEGSGDTLTDDSGNSQDATITGGLVDFWADSLVDKRIMDMEVVSGVNLYTDGKGHALPQSYSDLEELGGERFSGFTTIPTEWTDEGENVYSCDGSNASDSNMDLSTAFNGGSEHRTVIEVLGHTSGVVRIWLLSTANAAQNVAADEILEEQGVAGGPILRVSSLGSNPFVGKVKIHSIREVNPIVNQNDQNFLGKNGIINLSEVATTEEALKIINFLG